MRRWRNVSMMLFAALVFLAQPELRSLATPSVVLARVAADSCGNDCECDTPGFPEYIEGTCEDSNLCLDGYDACEDYCFNHIGGSFIENFDCDEPIEPPVEFSCRCVELFPN